MPCTVVVGAQWGDEGKGKIVDRLAGDAEIVARYQGGPNAGHSIKRGQETVVLHLVPSGAMHPGKRCLIGNGVVIDLPRLKAEVEGLERAGIELTGRLGVSPAAHLILPYHRAAEAVSEAGEGAIGTTGRGIGFAYRDKAGRVGLRVADLLEPERFEPVVDRNLERLGREFPEAREHMPASGAALLEELEPAIRWLAPMIRDVGLELHEALGRGANVLLEGAQGTLLDLDHGTYPYVTSSSSCAAGAPLGVGLGPRAVSRVIGVTKAYATRVGFGPFPSEMPEAEGARLREMGDEFGATTGRPRRCGWLDLPALSYAVRVNGLDGLIVTKLDVLDSFDEIRAVAGYEHEGRPVQGMPATVRSLDKVEPQWKSFPGWKHSTEAIRAWKDLPPEARAYLEWIEREAGVPVLSVSVGASRAAEIPRA
jgi:adenylosuccinate synthase